MSGNFDKKANDFFNSPQGAKLGEKKEALQDLMNSSEGQKVKRMMDGKADKLVDAFEKGDMATLSSNLSNILSTKEGAKIAEKLMEMFK